MKSNEYLSLWYIQKNEMKKKKKDEGLRTGGGMGSRVNYHWDQHYFHIHLT